jgi:beta-glucosidase
VLYGEDVYVGYRFYEKTDTAVLFPFGYGLSYTTFQMSGLSVTGEPASPQIFVYVEVQNTGPRAGAEVVQVYVSAKSPRIQRPTKELKGFQKVFLEPGETKSVRLVLERNYATSFWDESRHAWACEKGSYDVLVGNSSNGLLLSKSFTIEKTTWWSGLSIT